MINRPVSFDKLIASIGASLTRSASEGIACCLLIYEPESAFPHWRFGFVFLSDGFILSIVHIDYSRLQIVVLVEVSLACAFRPAVVSGASCLVSLARASGL